MSFGIDMPQSGACHRLRDRGKCVYGCTWKHGKVCHAALKHHGCNKQGCELCANSKRSPEAAPKRLPLPDGLEAADLDVFNIHNWQRSDVAQIRALYKVLVLSYHPDKARVGDTYMGQRQANQRFRDFSAAYERLTVWYGVTRPSMRSVPDTPA